MALEGREKSRDRQHNRDKRLSGEQRDKTANWTKDETGMFVRNASVKSLEG